MKILNKKNIMILVIGIVILGIVSIKLKKERKEIIETDKILVEKRNNRLTLIFIDKNGKRKEISNLDGIGTIKNGKPIVIYQNGKFGYLDKNGAILKNIEYEYASDFTDNVGLLKKNKMGAIDEKGQIIIPFDYEEIYFGKYNQFIIKEKNKYYTYNLKEKKPLDIEAIYRINGNRVIFGKNKKVGLMDYEGNIIIPNEYDEISRFVDKLFIGEKDTKYSLYNLNNKKVSKDFDFIEQLGNNEYKGGNVDDGKYAFLSEKIITPEVYEDIGKLNNEKYIGSYGDGTLDIIDKDHGVEIKMRDSELQNYIDKLQKGAVNEGKK